MYIYIYMIYIYIHIILYIYIFANVRQLVIIKEYVLVLHVASDAHCCSRLPRILKVQQPQATRAWNSALLTLNLKPNPTVGLSLRGVDVLAQEFVQGSVARQDHWAANLRMQEAHQSLQGFGCTAQTDSDRQLDNQANQASTRLQKLHHEVLDKLAL